MQSEWLGSLVSNIESPVAWGGSTLEQTTKVDKPSFF